MTEHTDNATPWYRPLKRRRARKADQAALDAAAAGYRQLLAHGSELRGEPDDQADDEAGPLWGATPGMTSVATLAATCPGCGESWVKQVAVTPDPTADWTRQEPCDCGADVTFTFPPADIDDGNDEAAGERP